MANNVQNYSTDPALAIEQAIARKLAGLRARVDLFAATFQEQGKPTQKAQIRIGWSGSTYKQVARSEAALFTQENARFELEVEVVDLKSHASAMQYIRQAVSLLTGYQPFLEVSMLEPQETGDPRFKPASKSWLYSCIMVSRWTLCNGEISELTPTEDLPAVTDVVVRVARFMPPDYEETIVDQFGG